MSIPSSTSPSGIEDFHSPLQVKMVVEFTYSPVSSSLLTSSMRVVLATQFHCTPIDFTCFVSITCSRNRYNPYSSPKASRLELFLPVVPVFYHGFIYVSLPCMVCGPKSFQKWSPLKRSNLTKRSGSCDK